MLSDALARERWTLRQAEKLIKKADWKHLMMEREVNRIDPDFQWANDEGSIKQPHPLAFHLANTER